MVFLNPTEKEKALFLEIINQIYIFSPNNFLKKDNIIFSDP